jgi:hypothetical protein
MDDERGDHRDERRELEPKKQLQPVLEAPNVGLELAASLVCAIHAGIVGASA